MAAPFLIPFNHMPYAIDVRDSPYTVPAGYYAYVLAGTADFTIDTESPFASTLYSVVASNSTKYIELHLPNGSYIEDWSLVVSGYSTGTHVSSIFLGPVASVSSLFAGLSLSRSSDGTTSSGFTYKLSTNVLTVSAASPDAATATVSLEVRSINCNGFWVPSGTDLAGTSYTVMIYPELV